MKQRAPLSMFEGLMQRAHARGVTRLRFECDLDAYFSDRPEKSWIATHGEEPHVRGRSGLEAMAMVVGRLGDA
jgi:hypothetical protein